MTWWAWPIVLFYGSAGVTNFFFIGKPRGPLTLRTALIVGVLNALCIWGIVTLAMS